MKSILTCLCALLCVVSTSAQIALTSSGYSNDFDSYIGTEATMPTGWTAVNTNFLGTSFGTDFVGGNYAYGTGGDYALGGLRSEAQTNIGYTATFVNSTSKIITDLEISFDFEQWRYSNNSGITVSSSLGDVSNLGQPVVAAGGMNGMATIISKSVALSNLSLAPDATFTISFTWNDEIGTNNGFGIDNFTISSIILPIHLEKYGLSQVEDKLMVAWSTSYESNNAHFTVEHSLDGRNFQTIGRIESQKDRSGEKDYAFFHESPIRGINYYRLNQFDLDGTKTSFNILSAEYKGKGDRFLYPTATDGQIFLSGVEDGNMDIFDATGRKVVQLPYTRGRGLDVAEFEKGIYYVIIGSERFKFVKI